MKILSLLPAATEIVYALDLEDDLIGVTFECDYPSAARAKRVVSDTALPAGLHPAEIDRAVRERSARGEPLNVLDLDYLREVPPDVILAQDLCRVCAVPTGDVEAALERLGCQAEVVSLDPRTLDELLDTILEVGRRTGAEARARALVEELRSRLSAVESALVDATPVPTLMLEWVDPPFVAGHWLPEMVERAGGCALLTEPGVRSRLIGWDEAAAVDPEAVVVAPCGFGLDAALAQAEGLPADLPGRRFAVDAAGYFVRPGPRVVAGIEALAAALHPAAGLGPHSEVVGSLDPG